MYTSLLTLVAFSAIASAHGNHDQSPVTGPHKQLWYNTLPGDGGTQVCISMLLVVFDNVVVIGILDFILSARYLGRLRLLWNLNIWTPPLLPMSGK